MKNETEIVDSAKKRILSTIAQSVKKISENENRVKKLMKNYDTKVHEITLTKDKIVSLAQIEETSKAQISQHIEMLTWLIETIDETVSDLKAKMVENSENASVESAQVFKNYLHDLQDIMTPLQDCCKIKEPEELKETVKGIAATLEIFAENVQNSTDSMAAIVFRANDEAVEESTEDFDGFVKDIHQIFETFNNILQKLKLTNSIKKYVELDEIYREINNIIDELATISEISTNIKVEKANNQLDLEVLEKYGLSKDRASLQARKVFLSNQIKDLQEKKKIALFEQEEVADKLDFIQNEKITIESFFEALSDEIGDNQTVTTETYNEMYATLDNIMNTIPFIKADLRNSSETAINSVIREFTKNAIAFGKFVGIIKKVGKVAEISKMQKSIALIRSKSDEYLKKMDQIINKLSIEVKESNTQAIEESFIEFLQFIENFKQKFYIIQDTVSSITLSTSENLINDLQGFSDDQIRYRLKIIEANKAVQFNDALIQKYSQLLQGLENELKIYSGKSDYTRRKVLQIEKSISESDSWLKQNIEWKIENKGIVPFEDVIICDKLPQNILEQQVNNEYKKLPVEGKGNILRWDIPSLDKREEILIKYVRTGFLQEPKLKTPYRKNISTPANYRYRNIAKPISLSIIERDGKGALILRNLGESDSIWNISLEFEATPDIEELPNVKIIGLKPQQSFIKKYRYKQNGSLVPKKFECQSKLTKGLIIKRSTLKENEYNIDLYLLNNSEFLLHMTSLDVFNLDDLLKPIIHVKEHELEILRPRVDFRKNFKLETQFGAPVLVIEANIALQLVYEYDIESRINLDDLQETPELIYSDSPETEALSQVLKSMEKKSDTIDPRLAHIEENISEIHEQIKQFELKLVTLRGKLKKKEEEKENLKILLEEEKQLKIKQEKLELKRKEEHQKNLEQEQQLLAEEQKKIELMKQKLKKSTKKSMKKSTPITKEKKSSKKSIKTSAESKTVSSHKSKPVSTKTQKKSSTKSTKKSSKKSTSKASKNIKKKPTATQKIKKQTTLKVTKK